MATEARSVVVHPAFAIEWRDLDDFCGEFGPHNGRYVPRYPSRWVADCLRHLHELDLPPLERARLLELARQELTHCTVPGEGKWNEETGWEDNASGMMAQRPEALIIGNGMDPRPFRGWAQCVGEVKKSRMRSWSFRGTVREYLQACKPLLVNAPAAYMIDPFLDPLSVNVQDLLWSILDLIKGSRCYQLHLITRHQACGGRHDEQDPSKWMKGREIEVELDRLYRGRVGKQRELLVHLMERPTRDPAALRLHDRFFLTRFGAISFGRGFVVEYQEYAQETAHAVDKDVHQRLKQEFIDGVARYNESPSLPPGIPRPSSVMTLEVAGG